MLCVKLLIKDHNVGVFAGSQSTVVFDNAYGARRVDGSTFDGACKGDPHFFYCRSHTVHQVGGRTCDRTILERSKVAADNDFLSAEIVLSILHTCCAHAVADQDDAVIAEDLEGSAHDCRMDMNAIADQLGHAVVIIGSCSDRSRRAVSKRRHGIEGMSKL